MQICKTDKQHIQGSEAFAERHPLAIFSTWNLLFSTYAVGPGTPIPSPLPCIDEACPPTFEMTPEEDNCSLGSHHPACTGLCQETGHKPLSTLLSWELLCDDLPFFSVGLKDLAHFSFCFKLTADLISWPSSIPGNGHGRRWKLSPTRTRLGWPPCLCDLGQETSLISEMWWWYPSIAPQLLWG